VAVLSSLSARSFIPWTLIRPAPFQQLKVTMQGSIVACPFISWALILICRAPFQQLEVTIDSSVGACSFIPWANIRPAPEVTIQSSVSACRFIP
jgi:hypothetical protein